jgi:CPA2 family monovalent cation:H+ antiporter-2
MGDAGLLVTLVFALGVAVGGAVLAAWLGQSVILGYILAGVVIGPYTPGFVGDPAAVKALADIGIILLMFTIGVHLSVRDLARAGTVALVGGVAQVFVTLVIGYAVGIALAWPFAQALFFGAVIAISSSAVLSKIIEEHGDGDSAHGRIALAWSTVQDLATIALVVILSAVAGAGSNLLTDLLIGAGKAGLFLAVLIPLGLVVLPRLFEHVAALQSREVFVLLVAAVALGIAYASSFFGVSLALGAFVAGLVVGESDLSHQILGAILPLRDIFAALFFVSVGMLVDPAFVAQHWPLVLLTVALIVLLKGALVAGLVVLFRSPARTALVAGVLLAQAGEFSFLLARLGAEQRAVTSAVFSLMLAGAVVSIVLAPTLYRAAAPLAAWVDRRRPSPAAPDDPNVRAVQGLHGHAVICGYGRVGRVIVDALRPHLPLLVVEQDPRVVRALRAQAWPSVTALVGDAANPVLLERMHLAQARLLVAAIPDALAVRAVVAHARRVNPTLDIVVRTHSQTEHELLARYGVTESVLGELELAREMTRYALQHLHSDASEAPEVGSGLRDPRIAREEPRP